MPDICMCFGMGCPEKETCYRYTAKPSEYQSYFEHPPYLDGECEYYWKTEHDTRIQNTDRSKDTTR